NTIYNNLNRTKKGKPFLKNYPEYCFNISHSGKYVGCVFNTSAVGLDIQKKTNYSMNNIASNLFSSKEYIFLQSKNDFQNQFIRLWTRKESICKAYGTGLDEKVLRIPVLSNLVGNYRIYSLKLSQSYWQSVCSYKFFKKLVIYEVSIDDILSINIPKSSKIISF
ncbi:4'-phosphopantetheinyl transferase superfamily protein, partial [Lactobacillus sp. XV13L]|nr:4'-phosphopantetheinyl transferase superfamily protein [Lactobacillus sp. XV13L]